MHARTKHFDIQLYFIRNTIEEKKIAYEYLCLWNKWLQIFSQNHVKDPKHTSYNQKNLEYIRIEGACGVNICTKVNPNIVLDFLSIFFSFSIYYMLTFVQNF